MVPVPPLTAESRTALLNVVSTSSENAKTSIRRARSPFQSRRRDSDPAARAAALRAPSCLCASVI